MSTDAWMVWLGAMAGLAVSVGIESLLRPRPPIRRLWPAWALHTGVWALVYATLTLILARPWFATAGASALLLILVQVNNAKMQALREPFVFQDYEYFTDAIRHPRLYIPFLGWGKFLGAAAGVALAVAIGFWGETAPESRLDWSGQLGGIAVVLGVGGLLLLVARVRPLPICFDPHRDMRQLGLLASLWRYAQEERKPLRMASPFELLMQKAPDGERPHLVAVQSESFFDPRPLFAGIRPDVLSEFDRLKADAVVHGKLKVPAWGANTVRTEFAFLTGIDEPEMGVHRFNPYRAIAAGQGIQSLASYLKRQDYRTVCLHPYPASFYQRDRVLPRLGFDEFLDIREFEGAERFGPYISDAAVADKIASLLGASEGPMFVFAITMENHGPLHLEQVAATDAEAMYFVPPPDGCDDLTIYLRHLRNANQMVGRLRGVLEQCSRPAGLCWFGDHVPILPTVYETLATPQGEVPYVLWRNDIRGEGEVQDLKADRLALLWLEVMKLAPRH